VSSALIFLWVQHPVIEPPRRNRIWSAIVRIPITGMEYGTAIMEEVIRRARMLVEARSNGAGEMTALLGTGNCSVSPAPAMMHAGARCCRLTTPRADLAMRYSRLRFDYSVERE